MLSWQLQVCRSLDCPSTSRLRLSPAPARRSGRWSAPVETHAPSPTLQDPERVQSSATGPTLARSSHSAPHLSSVGHQRWDFTFDWQVCAVLQAAGGEDEREKWDKTQWARVWWRVEAGLKKKKAARPRHSSSLVIRALKRWELESPNMSSN